MLKWPNLYYSTSRVRARSYYPKDDHRLREHARRRQGDVRRLLPDGPVASTASSARCPTCRSATTCGRSSCARTRVRVFNWMHDTVNPAAAPTARRATVNRYPFPMPFGWFQVGVPGGPRRRRDQGALLLRPPPRGVARRARRAHVMDAFCPHLGAHLGHGGTVEGCELVCPFHGWKFDAEGHNTDIPYSDRTNRKARDPHVSRPWSATAICSSGTTPTTKPPAVGDPGGRRVHRRPTSPVRSAPTTSSNAGIQEMARERRRLGPLPLRAQHRDGARDRVVRDRRPSQPRCGRCRSSRRPAAWSTAASTTHAEGPGVGIVWFSGIVDTLPGGRVHADRRADRPRSRFNFNVRNLGDARDDLERRQGVRGRGRQAVRGGHADLGAQGPPRATGAGRHRRAVHEVPQVVRQFYAEPVSRRARRLPASLLAGPDGRVAGQGHRVSPARRANGEFGSLGYQIGDLNDPNRPYQDRGVFGPSTSTWSVAPGDPVADLAGLTTTSPVAAMR